MKIREVEIETGMDRGNIRFYEKEGLIHPVRKENGYRIFTKEDIETLLRIKLLRSIHVALLDIKALLEEKVSLQEILEKQIRELDQTKEDVYFAQKICIAMKDRGLTVKTLEAKSYLDQLQDKAMASGTKYFKTDADKLAQVSVPGF